MSLIIRNSSPDDLPQLVALSPPEIKPTVQFFVHATLVAEVDGVIAGYTQSCLTPDGILHSTAIRIGKQWKGQGIGWALLERKVALAREAGARMHIYAVDPAGEIALKKILERLGMHCCQRRGDVLIYMQGFGDEVDPHVA